MDGGVGSCFSGVSLLLHMSALSFHIRDDQEVEAGALEHLGLFRPCQTASDRHGDKSFAAEAESERE